MEAGEKKSPADRGGALSPSHSSANPFDPANLLNSHAFAAAAAAASNAYGQFPGYSMYGSHPLFPGALPFGGLGLMPEGIPNPLAAAGLSQAGGAEWWRAASEQARRLAQGSDFYDSILPGSLPQSYGGRLGIESPSLAAFGAGSLFSPFSSGLTTPSTTSPTQQSSLTSSPGRSSANTTTTSAITTPKSSHPINNSPFSPAKSPALSSASARDRSSSCESKHRDSSPKKDKKSTLPGDLSTTPYAASSMAPFYFPFGMPGMMDASNLPLPFSSSLFAPGDPSALSMAESSLFSATPSSSSLQSTANSSSKTTHSSASSKEHRISPSLRNGGQGVSSPNRTSSAIPTSVISAVPKTNHHPLPSPAKRNERSQSSSSHVSSIHDSESEKGFRSPAPAHVHSSKTPSIKSNEIKEAHKETPKETSMEGVLDLSCKKSSSSSSPCPSPAHKPPSESSSNRSESRPRSESRSRSESRPRSESRSESPSKKSTSSEDKSRMSPKSLANMQAEQLLASAAEIQEKMAKEHAQLLASAYSQNLADMSALGFSPGFMPPMYDALTGMLIPPPPPPSSALMSSSSSSGGRGRGRGRGSRGGGRGSRGGGRGSRGGRSGLSSRMALDGLQKLAEGASNNLLEEAKSGRGRRGGGRGRGRAKNVESRLLQELREQHESRKSAEVSDRLRQQMEAERKLLELQTRLAEKYKEREMIEQKKTDTTPSAELTNGEATPSEKLESTEQTNLASSLMGPNDIISNKILEKVRREVEAEKVHSGDSSASMSDLTESDTMGTNSEQSESEESGSESGNDSTEEGGKRRRHNDTDTDGEFPRPKKRRTIFDEKEIRIPLEHGWRRETKVRAIKQRGIAGDVLYHAPCGKKLRTYPEVEKYLQRNNITDLTRENFSFTTSVNVGEFYEYRADSKSDTGYVLLSEAEVADRFIAVEARKKRILERKAREDRRKDRKRQALEMARKLEEMKAKKRNEQQELARKVAEIKIKKKLEKQEQKEATKKVQQLRVMEMKRMKERQRLMKQHERYQKQQQMKVEREMRSQQMVEEKEMKRQQLVVLKEQERERRRQHLLLVRAHEARKKQEDREKIREKKRTDKKMKKQVQIEQKRLEIAMERETRKPVEDMCLKDRKDLPDLDRMDGVLITGEAFANCLMTIEFCMNFASVLGFDGDSLPTLNELQQALLNNEEYLPDFYNLIFHLLALALDDPGVPKNAVTSNGQKVEKAAVNEYTFSEIMRIFILYRTVLDEPMRDWLEEKPFQSLNATQKSSLLAFLCNELLSSKNVVGEIEGNIDKMTTLRRDKWELDAELRKLKAIKSRRFYQSQPKPSETENSMSTMCPSTIADESNISAPSTPRLGKKCKDEDDESGGSDAEMDVHLSDTEIQEQKAIPQEELDKKIEKLSKQQNQFRNKVNSVSHKLRGTDLGQDRYKRRYWALQHCGGVYVESMESAETEIEGWELQDGDIKTVNIKNEIVDSESKVVDHNHKQVNGADGANLVNGCDKNSDSLVIKDNGLKTEDLKSIKEGLVNGVANESIEQTKPRLVNGDVIDSQSNMFLQKSEAGSVGVAKTEKNSTDPAVPNTNVFNSQQGLNSPDKLSAFRSVENVLSPDNKNKQFSNSPFITPQNLHPSTYLSSTPLAGHDHARHSTNHIAAPSPKDGWFNLLPKNPCDKSSITQSPTGNTNSKISQLSPFKPNGPMYSPFQMGFMHNSPKNSTMSPFPFHNTSMSSPYQLSGIMTPMGMFNSPTEFIRATQYPEPESIPIDKRHGWWKITDAEKLKFLLSQLHPRAVRERVFQKNLQKELSYAIESMSFGNNEATSLDDSDIAKSFLNTPSGAPVCDEDPVKALETEKQVMMAILDEIQDLEDRICGASLQTKDYVPPAKKPGKDEGTDYVIRPEGDLKPNQKILLDVCKEKLLFVEKLIERRYLKYPFARQRQINLTTLTTPVIPPPNLKDGNNSDSEIDEEKQREREMEEEVKKTNATRDLVLWRKAVTNASNGGQLMLCLLQCNHAVAWEKSVMKVKCQICTKDDNEAELLLCDNCDKGYHMYCFKPAMTDIPDGNWYCYECVSKATGQLHCARCGLTDGKMASCDACPKAIHLKCIDPPLMRMPRKWSCEICVISGKGKKRKRSFQNLQYLDAIKDETPPPEPVPEALNQSEDTIHEEEEPVAEPEPEATPTKPEKKEKKKKDKDKEKKKKKAKSPKHEVEKEVDVSIPLDDTPKKEKKKKKKKKGLIEPPTSPLIHVEGKQNDVFSFNGEEMDFTPCRKILRELETHEEGWPFLKPVNTKEFPQYRKFIKCPMDFSTMKHKLRDNVYESYEEFAEDARLIFNNCQIFNEDESPVGEAGHAVRKFFEERWAVFLSSVKKHSMKVASKAPPSANKTPPSESADDSQISALNTHDLSISQDSQATVSDYTEEPMEH